MMYIIISIIEYFVKFKFEKALILLKNVYNTIHLFQFGYYVFVPGYWGNQWVFIGILSTINTFSFFFTLVQLNNNKKKTTNIVTIK